MNVFSSPRRIAGLLLGLILVSAGVVGWRQRTVFTSWVAEQPYRATLPSALPVTGSLPTPIPTLTPAIVSPSPTPPSALTGDVNLDVPFQAQAPFRDWSQPYQDACEEAAIIMVERSLRGATLSKEEMKAEILKIVDFENKRFGTYHDTNAQETAELAEAFYPHLRAELRYDVTADSITALLREGHPVILLVNGRKLGNPFYTPPGPDKHALVLKGIKGDKFVTNDPGIGRGHDFMFPITTVMNATVDYNGRTPGTGKKAGIILTER
jgi:peptidase C39-like protein